MITNQQVIIAQLQSGANESLSKAIRDIIALNAVPAAQAQRMWDYYEGRHDILKRTIDDETKPNNKLVHDFPGEIIDTVVGYFIGNPVSYSSDDDKLLEALKQVQAANSEELHNERMVREMCIAGRVYELLYLDEEGKPRWMKVPATEMATIADGSRTDEIAYALRYYPITIDGKAVTKCELYDRAQVSYWLLDGEALTPYTDDGVADAQGAASNVRPHIFGQVPVVEYTNGDSRLGDFEKVMSLIDDYDKRDSDNSNELEYFRNAYLVIKNMSGTENEDLTAIKQSGAFKVDGDGDVTFLTKTVNDAVVEHHFARLEANISKFSKTPNLADEKFGGNLSGIAIRFKLTGLENKCVTKERYMTAALRRRWQLINAYWTTIGNSFDVNALRWEFKRNVPVNLGDEATLAKDLKGIVSDETILTLLSFIDDPAAELERLKAEREASVAPYFTDRTDNETGGATGNQAAGDQA